MSYPATLVIVNEMGQIAVRDQNSVAILPEVEVEEGRVGISLYRAVRRQLGIETFALVGHEDLRTTYYLLRLQRPTDILPPGFVWASPDRLFDADGVSAIVAAVASSAERIGGYVWYSRVAAWLEQRVRELGSKINVLEQWNGRVGGVLLRVVTDGPQFWFKAGSEFNTREMQIAELLADKHPANFPRIVARKEAWNAFLLEHVDGRELFECGERSVWESTARALADLQLDWMGSSDALLKAGAADLRAGSMGLKIPAFLDHVDDAMSRQSKTPPKRLARIDLMELETELYMLCADVHSLAFKEGLANADFSPHNALITERCPVFIDWAEAAVSLPLIVGEYMWNRMAVESPERASWKSALRSAYLSRWEKNYGATQVERAVRLLPAFAILAVAMFYHERECHGPSPYDAYIRSLARKLDDCQKRSTDESYAVPA